MALITQNTLLLAKEESTYGTDPTPTTGSNAFLAYDVELRPQSTVIERNPMSVTLSREKTKNTFKFYEISFMVEIAGSGSAGTAPRGVGDLLEACGMSETVVGATSVTYKPATSSLKSVTIYGHKDGIMYELNGCVGNVNIIARAGETPKYQFSLSGLYNIPADTTFPSSATFDSTQPEVCQGLTYTFGSSLAPNASSLEINLNNEIGRLDTFAGADGIAAFAVTSRNPQFTLETEAITRATSDGDLWSDLGTFTSRAMSLALGATAGNICTITTPAAVIDNMNVVDRNGIQSYSLTGSLARSSGDDEVSIAYT
jgi:hypothetical protein